MHTKAEVVAVLLAEDDSRSQQSATMLMRDANGEISVQTASADSTLVQRALLSGYFRRGKAIIDPVSRQMIGYEMEQVDGALSSMR